MVMHIKEFSYLEPEAAEKVISYNFLTPKEKGIS